MYLKWEWTKNTKEKMQNGFELKLEDIVFKSFSQVLDIWSTKHHNVFIMSSSNSARWEFFFLDLFSGVYSQVYLIQKILGKSVTSSTGNKG